jgi:hypothetical protein
MKPSGPSLIAAALLLAVCLPAAAGPSKGPAKRSVAPASEIQAAPLTGSMIFYLAKGEPNSCGSGCSEWIAAEGTLTRGTAERMRAFLKRQSGKHPIYFYSPGGITSESIAMGRLMRERGITAGVARTIPQGCDSATKECVNGKRSGRVQSARLTSSLSQCNSACVYAIVGARVREIAPEAHLGVHASRTVIVGKLPQGVKVSADMRANFRNENRLQIRRYLADMGIQPALLDAAEKIPHESIRALSREEMVRFGIDTRSVVESGWIYDDRITDRGGIFKSIDETEAGGVGYRKTLLRLSCLSKEEFLVGYAREVGPKENSFMPLKIVAAKEEFTLTPPHEAFTGNNSKKRYDVRRVWMPVRVFASAAAEDGIELASDTVEGKPGITKLSTIGLASALSSLSRRCSHPSDIPPPGGAALAPRHLP